MPRFASEYGFQAFPGFEVMSNYSLPQDRNFYSEYVDHIQHHGDGNAQLKSQLSNKVRLRPLSYGFCLTNMFKALLFTSCVLQSFCQI